MNPPAEQLVRDYLNRVSVAARGRLSPEDRRAFVARTRELIERNTRGLGQGSPMGVARFLNGLGDPAALVARERERLAAQPPGTPADPSADAAPRRSRLSRERRPRSDRSGWMDRLRPSAAPLSGVPVPRPVSPDSSAPGAARAGRSTGAGDAAAGPEAGAGAGPRIVLAGDVVTGHVPTPDEPAPGPASESVSRPVPEPPGGRVPRPRTPSGTETAAATAAGDSAGPAQAAGPAVPLPADVRSGPRRLGWPWQGMNGTAADLPAATNGHGPGPGPARPEPEPEREPERDPGVAAEHEPEPERGPGAAADAVGGTQAASAASDTGVASDTGAAPGAVIGPEAGSAPVIGRWAGGTPVTGDQAPGIHSAGSANGRAPANGQAPEHGMVASDFTAGGFTDGDGSARPGSPAEAVGPMLGSPAPEAGEPDAGEPGGGEPGGGAASGGAAGGGEPGAGERGTSEPRVPEYSAGEWPADEELADEELADEWLTDESLPEPPREVPTDERDAAVGIDAVPELADAPEPVAAFDAGDPGPEVAEPGAAGPDVTGAGPAAGRWVTGTRGAVGGWAGWKPTRGARPPAARPRPYLPRRPSPSRPAAPSPTGSRPARPRPSLRSALSRPSPPRPSASRPGSSGPSGSPGSPGSSGPSGSLGPSRASRPVLPPGTLATAGAGARKAVRYAAVQARQRPLEAVAVVLIGLGGAVYPPVWLLGAALAVASRVWDARDKWLGLAIPVFLVIVGMGADVSLSGAQPNIAGYFREAWIFGSHLSRIVAVLGAVYLAWRSQQPRRQQSAEPWKKARRFN